jgi:hypothetical protein
MVGRVTPSFPPALAREIFAQAAQVRAQAQKAGVWS